MPDSRPAPSVDIPPPPPGTIPPPPPPNAPPASTNALGNTTPTTPATPVESLAKETGTVGSTGTKVSSFISNISSGKLDAENTTITLVIIGWVVFGLAGFVMSLWCLGFSGSASQKFGGVLFALILGPFYWAYFYSVPSYCARLPPPSTLF